MFVDVTHGQLFLQIVEPTDAPAGELETAVFLHGVAATHEMWGEWTGVLGPSLRFLLIDTRGCGRSGGTAHRGGQIEKVRA